MALPANVGKGTVIGRFGILDGTVVGGSVTFTPSPLRWIDSSSGPPMTLLPKPTTVNLDVTGYFAVDLVATDDTDLNPTAWTYAVSFNFANGTAAPFSISVPEGTTVDLGVVTPVATSNGVQTIRGPGLPAGGGAGQVMIKQSTTDGDSAWGNATDIVGYSTGLAAKAGRVLTQKVITGNYTLVAADMIDTVLHITSATPVTITLPKDASVTAAQEVPVDWVQYGAGVPTFVCETGASLVSRGNAFKSAGQYACGAFKKPAANVWLVWGDLVP